MKTVETILIICLVLIVFSIMSGDGTTFVASFAGAIFFGVLWLLLWIIKET